MHFAVHAVIFAYLCILHITNQCTYELFAAQASGTHELKANARAHTSKCNYHIVGALELTLPLYSARPNWGPPKSQFCETYFLDTCKNAHVYVYTCWKIGHNAHGREESFSQLHGILRQTSVHCDEWALRVSGVFFAIGQFMRLPNAY